MSVKQVAEKFGADIAEKELLKQQIKEIYEILENFSKRIEYLEKGEN